MVGFLAGFDELWLWNCDTSMVFCAGFRVFRGCDRFAFWVWLGWCCRWFPGYFRSGVGIRQVLRLGLPGAMLLGFLVGLRWVLMG